MHAVFLCPSFVYSIGDYFIAKLCETMGHMIYSTIPIGTLIDDRPPELVYNASMACRGQVRLMRHDSAFSLPRRPYTTSQNSGGENPL